MKVYREWVLLKPLADDEMPWLINLGVRVNCKRDPMPINHNNTTYYYYAGQLRVTIYSETNEQAEMLLLKYGDSIIMRKEEYILQDWQPCVLGEINFDNT